LHTISIWDALILQAARQSGCERLLTEDLQAGAVIGGVRIVNPFDVPAPTKTRRAKTR
jgi:predicted nucleic acid-binding protein